MTENSEKYSRTSFDNDETSSLHYVSYYYPYNDVTQNNQIHNNNYYIVKYNTYI